MQSNRIVLFFERLGHDVRYGARLFRKSPGFTAVAVLSLALGIGANTAIFSLVNAYLLRPLPVAEPERLLSIFTTDADNPGNLDTSHQNFIDYRDKNDVFSGVLAYSNIPLILNTGDQSERINGQIVSGNYFDVLGVRAAFGRTFLPEEDRTPGTHPSVVLGYNFWKRRFNSDPAVVGRVVKLNTHDFNVVGVAPANFTGTDLGTVPDVWVPMMMYKEAAASTAARYNNRRFLFLSLIGRLKPGVSAAQAQQSLGILSSELAREYPTDNEGRGVRLMPLSEARLNPEGDNMVFRASALLMGIVGAVLLIACANVANLLLARSASRRKEISIRLAVGAGRGRLITQLLTESVLLSLIGGVLGLLLANWTKDLLWSLMPPDLGTEGVPVALDSRVLLFTLLLAVVSGLVFGLVPALQASKPELVGALKGTGVSAAQRPSVFNFRRWLVVAEVSLCLVSLVVSTLFVRSLSSARKVDPGFQTENVLLLATDLGLQGYDDARGARFYQQLVERVKGLAGVRQAVVSRNRPFGQGFGRTVFIEGREDMEADKGVLIQTNSVGPEYFKALGIPLVGGRDFGDEDRADAPLTVVVNEAMARRFWPNEGAVGKRLKLFGDKASREVVGVVKDTRFDSLLEDHKPYLYLPLSQNYTPAVTLYVRTAGDPAAVTAAVRREVQSLDSTLPVFDVRTLREQTDRSLWAERATAVLLMLFGVLALALAASGIFGVVSYFVSQRTRDIGIRIALGARWSHVISFVMKEGLLLVGVGILLGAGAALALARLLGSMLFGVSPYDPFAFIAAPLVLIVVAAIASYVPARRATKVDPLYALRAE
jgi:putative ABC transport system permease protein